LGYTIEVLNVTRVLKRFKARLLVIALLAWASGAAVTLLLAAASMTPVTPAGLIGRAVVYGPLTGLALVLLLANFVLPSRRRMRWVGGGASGQSPALRRQREGNDNLIRYGNAAGMRSPHGPPNWP
jgi:hypothetical protein